MSNRLVLGLVGLSSMGILLGRKGKRQKRLLSATTKTGTRCAEHTLHIIQNAGTGNRPEVGRGVRKDDTITWVARDASVHQFGITFTAGGSLIVCPNPDGQGMFMSSEATKRKMAELTCTVAAPSAGAGPDGEILCYYITSFPSRGKTGVKGTDQFVRHCTGC